MTSTLWLSCHVDYACRHSGVCCRAGWPLPVEGAVVSAIDDAVAAGRLATVDDQRKWIAERIDAPDGIVGTLRQAGGACVFHRLRDGRLNRTEPTTALDGRQRAGATAHECAVHATLGHAALPSTCQHFPRVCLVDDRGVRVTLSHVCPTARAMLVGDDRPLAIVPGPAAVVGREVPEGLDARVQLPPRLSPRVLTDWAGLTAWEAHIVNTLAGPDAPGGSAEGALARLAGDAATLSAWTPRAGSLAEAVERVTRRVPADRSDAAGAASAADRREANAVLVRATCRAPWTWPDLPLDRFELDGRWVAPVWASHAAVVRRYLAARAFGAWASYRLDATRGLMAWLGVVLDVLRTECLAHCARADRLLDRTILDAAIGRADLLLLHYADELAVAEALARRA